MANTGRKRLTTAPCRETRTRRATRAVRASKPTQRGRRDIYNCYKWLWFLLKQRAKAEYYMVDTSYFVVLHTKVHRWSDKLYEYDKRIGLERLERYLNKMNKTKDIEFNRELLVTVIEALKEGDSVESFVLFRDSKVLGAAEVLYPILTHTEMDIIPEGYTLCVYKRASEELKKYHKTPKEEKQVVKNFRKDVVSTRKGKKKLPPNKQSKKTIFNLFGK